MEQAKQRVANEKKKQNEKKWKAENHAIEHGQIKKGVVVMLCGTAAGLTVNIMLLRY